MRAKLRGPSRPAPSHHVAKVGMVASRLQGGSLAESCAGWAAGAGDAGEEDVGVELRLPTICLPQVCICVCVRVCARACVRIGG